MSNDDNHDGQRYCNVCGAWYNLGEKHERTLSHIRTLAALEEPVTLVESAFRSRYQTFFLRNLNANQLDYERYMKDDTAPVIHHKIRDSLIELTSVKVNIVVYSLYKKPEDDPENKKKEEKKYVSFKTTNYTYFRESDIEGITSEMAESIIQEAIECTMNESGYTLEKIIGTELRINFNSALSKGSSYLPLPFTTNAVVNVKNEDHMCFKYAVLGKHLPPDTMHKYRVTKYTPYLQRYDFSCVPFPTSVQDVSKFEKRNDVSISVFGIDGYDDSDSEDEEETGRGEYDDIGLGPDDYIQGASDDDAEEDVDEPDDVFVVDARPKKKKKVSKKKKKESKKQPQIYPLRVSREEKPDHIDLLYFTKGKKSHWCYISDFEKLVGSQLTKHQHRIFICKACFYFNKNEDSLTRHKQECNKLIKREARIEYPADKECVLQFKDHSKALTHKYVAYCDFECYLEDVDFDPNQPTFAYQYHKTMSFAYTVVSPDPEINTDEPILYRGPDAHNVFLDAMIGLAERIAERFQIEKDIRMDAEAEAAFQAVTECQLCDLRFSKDNPKVRDHDHQYVDPEKSNYRMALCRRCNLQFKHPRTLMVVFHNGSPYDFHKVVKALSGRNLKPEIIAQTSERYITIIVRPGKGVKIQFIDSFKFLAASLEKLASTLPDEAFIRTRSLCSTPEQLEIAKQKAVFCYDYVTDETKLEVTQPPPKEEFYSKLKSEHISDADYARFCKTWELFGFENLGEYVDFYLKLDVCLLADVFQEFRKFGQQHYKLDPANFLTLPSFAFRAFLKMTKVKIDLFKESQHEMTTMILTSIRGGISQSMLRHAVANNPYLKDSYDPREPETYLAYFDVTALYAFTMCKPLPRGDYRWLEPHELVTFTEDKIRSLDENGDIGYIFEVDLEYPEELHDKHVDLPFCCENQVPPQLGSKHPKLLTTLEHKRKYTIHYVALKQALKHGLKLLALRRGIRFHQRPYLREFIELNARLRQEAKGNEFHQSLLKLCSNACYGKFLENPLKRKKMLLASTEQRMAKLIRRADFLDRKIFDQKLAVVELHKKTVKFDRPGIVGFSILDLSKVHMYQFHYEEMLKRYPRENVHIVYMDTDSFIYSVKTPDLYADLRLNLNIFDTSNYPKDHPCFSDKNYKVMGTFKDETGGDPIVEVVAIRAKLYLYRTASKTDKRAKGVQKSVVQKSIGLDDFIDGIYQNKDAYRDARTITSKKHEIYTVQSRKKAICSYDDKRFILQGNVVSLPFGHYALKKRSDWAEHLQVRLAGIILLRSHDRRTGVNLRENLERIENLRLALIKATWLGEKRKRPAEDSSDDVYSVKRCCSANTLLL